MSNGFFGSSISDTNPKQNESFSRDSSDKPSLTARKRTAHLRHDFDLLIPPLEGQGEDLGPPVGHGRWLAVDHQVHPVGLRGGRLRVLLRADHVQGLRDTWDPGVGWGGAGREAEWLR